MAGYSEKPLAQKLGLKEGSRFTVLNGPEGFEVEGMPGSVATSDRLIPDTDVVLFFTKSARELEKHFPALITSTVDRGSVWISWPKKSSGVATDLHENLVRDIGLALGVVDVKVCAVDDTWSGLKFVRRLGTK